MRKRVGFLSLGVAASLALLFGVTRPARGAGLTAGLAVAVTSDGSRLVAGGSNRALYELDPKTLTVKRRVWLGRQVMRMAFSPDGKVLVVESTAAVQWLKADTLEPFHTLKDASRMQPLPSIGAVALWIPSYTKPAIGIYGFVDAKERAAVPLNPRDRIAAFGVSEDGKRVALIHAQKKKADEEKITGRKIPEALRKAKGAALAEFTQRHDGMGARYQVIDVATGKPTLEKPLWYACQGYADLVRWRGDDVLVIGERNQCARIDAKGEVSVFVIGEGRVHAFFVTPDAATIWASAMLVGRRTETKGLSSTTFVLDAMPGFNEVFKAFTVAADGTAFAGTTASRVLRIGADGTLGGVAPVY